MAYLTLLLTLSALLPQVLCAYYTVGASGGVLPRREIRDLAKNYPQQYSLFIQALQSFQNSGTANVASYFQIAGIHGAPNTDWDGVSGDGDGSGYCPHAMNLFSTWHRPYLATFEQQLQTFARLAAYSYTGSDKQQWADAAIQLRLPYYDAAIRPASGKPEYPYELGLSTVTIQFPSGQKTVNNPLYSYKMGKPVPGVSNPPYDTWPNTLRWPSSNDQSAGSRSDKVQGAISQNRPGIQSNVYQFLSQCNDYALLSKDYAGRPPSCPVGLEQIHDNIHGQIGGGDVSGGHMSAVPYSAFDPIFMLHHANVDRLFAMWQVIYPNSWVVNTQTSSRTRTIHSGSFQGPTSPLSPFRNKAGQFWTSDTVRDMRVFNYTYPEVISANGNANSMRQQVAALYGPSASQTASKRQTTDNIIEYNANIVTSNYALGSTYFIMIFLGNPSSSDPGSWLSDRNLVGSASILASPEMKDVNINTSATVSLTLELQRRIRSTGGLSSLDPTAVIPFLKSNLQWRIMQLGKEIDPKTVPNFKVTVVKSIRASDVGSRLAGFSKWDSFEPLPDVTSGKAGGAKA